MSVISLMPVFFGGFMFGFLHNKKKKRTDIFAPVDGKAISLEEVGDGVFSEKLVGDGIAIIPKQDEIVIPVEGTVSFVMDTGHAFGVRVPGGPEVLVHIGIDTVNEKGKGFQVLVKEKQEVKMGMLAVRIDRKDLAEKGYSLPVMVLVPEAEKYGTLEILLYGEVSAGKNAVLALSGK